MAILAQGRLGQREGLHPLCHQGRGKGGPGRSGRGRPRSLGTPGTRDLPVHVRLD